MNPSADSARYLFTLVMISLHNSSQHTTSQQVTLPAYCQLVGKKDKSNIVVRKDAKACPQYNSANGKETDWFH